MSVAYLYSWLFVFSVAFLHKSRSIVVTTNEFTLTPKSLHRVPSMEVGKHPLGFLERFSLIYMYVCMYVCMHACMHLYIFIKSNML
jgi:hypothetical protein